MATRAAIAERASAARNRLNGAMERLSKRHGVPLPPPPEVHYRQPELKSAAEMERLADFMETVLGETKPEPEKKKQPEEQPERQEDEGDDEPTFHGYPLSEFDGKSDDEILEGYRGIGAATLAKIRAAQKDRE